MSSTKLRYCSSSIEGYFGRKINRWAQLLYLTLKEDSNIMGLVGGGSCKWVNISLLKDLRGMLGSKECVRIEGYCYGIAKEGHRFQVKCILGCTFAGHLEGDFLEESVKHHHPRLFIEIGYKDEFSAYLG